VLSTFWNYYVKFAKTGRGRREGKGRTARMASRGSEGYGALNAGAQRGTASTQGEKRKQQ